MFQRLTHHPGLTQAQHRALPHVSNTDLSRLADELLGRPRSTNPYTTDALTFGTYFHSATLEPGTFCRTNPADRRDEQHRQQAAVLAAAIRRRRYPRHVLYLGQAEQTYTAIHTATGVVVKVRPDLLIDSPKGRRRTLVDFKTTSCRDLTQFLETVDKYGYDQQGALYADVLGAQRVVLIAVQKKAPKGQEPAVWVHELTPAQIDLGRKKYGKLLRCWSDGGDQLVRSPLFPAKATA